MWLDKLTPSKFLCKYSLKCGAKVVGAFMIIITIICIITSAFQVVYLGTCRDCKAFASHTAYAYSITAVIYCVAMLILTIWFLCGIKKKKSSVILAYAVIGTTWLVLSFCLLIVLLCLYGQEANMKLAWLLANLILGLIFVALLSYGFLVVYGYWRQTKTSFIGSAMGS